MYEGDCVVPRLDVPTILELQSEVLIVWLKHRVRYTLIPRSYDVLSMQGHQALRGQRSFWDHVGTLSARNTMVVTRQRCVNL